MSRINYTYGILTGGMVPDTSVWYRNCKNIKYTCDKQYQAIHTLWGTNRSAQAIGCSVDAIIKLLQCDEQFGRYLNEYDIFNTYDTPITYNITDIPEDALTFATLVNWADKLQYVSATYPVVPAQPQVVRVTNALLSVLTLKG